jgi:antitoxin PrlF
MTTINSAGQVTIPEPIRDALGLEAGSEVVFEYQGDGKAVIHRADKTPQSRFAKLRGSLKSDLTTDEIMAMTRGED